jgi:predicted RNA-binding protein YlxR (DUF448 family)
MAARERKIPRRTCVACGAGDDKRRLVRLVRAADGSVAVDATGKQPGRGAYLCPKRACFEEARRTGQLARALRTRIDDEEYGKLFDEFMEVAGTEGVSADVQLG